MRRTITLICLLLFYMLFVTAVPARTAEQSVGVIRITGEINYGTVQYVERSYQEDVDLILMEIDTPGGLIEAATQVVDVIRNSEVETAAYVTGGAISAGALLALTAPDLFMAPGTSIGAAEPRIGTQKADEKILSYWRGELKKAAERNGRNGDIAAAMADADISIPGVIEKGKLLTLTSGEALELEMIDAILEDREAVLQQLDLAEAEVVEILPENKDFFWGWLTNPIVSGFLLMFGIAGLAIELLTVGFGVAGVLGLLSLSLYFGSHILVGLTGWWTLLLFLVGLILLAIEVLAVPGFGVPGIAGIAAVVASIIWTAPSVDQAIISLVIALIGTIVLIFLSIRFLPTRNLWKRLALGSRQNKEEGYVAPVRDLSDLVGKEGVAVTPLHPSGAVKIEDRRVDVVTEGDYIAKGTPVRVIKTEGTRVVVSRLK